MSRGEKSADAGTRPFGRALTGALAVILAGVAAFQVFFRPHATPTAGPSTRLVEALPNELQRWTVADELLGQTEAGGRAALRTLNLDDYVYRRFSKGATWFTIYGAYWPAGRMPTRLVASHTPDRCWTENGMQCVEMGFREIYRIEGKELLPAEYRAFIRPVGDQKTFVAYWHTVEGKVYDYGARFSAVPHPWLWWKDTLAQATQGSREQLFVRIASNTPLNELWTDRDFQTVMTKVADLGLWDSAGTR